VRKIVGILPKKNLGYFCNYRKNLPKINNGAMGENSPNLVTLPHTAAAWKNNANAADPKLHTL
jgi:hypothetical protein